MMITDVIKSLLPKGPLWDSLKNPIITPIVDLLTAVFQPVADGAEQLTNEIHPTKANDLNSYAEMLGFDPNTPKAKLRSDIILRLGQKGSQSREFYVAAIRATTGLSVEILEFRARRCGKVRAGSRLASPATDYTFAIKGVPTAKTAEVIEVVKKMAQSHTYFFVIP